jgi:hypothetical protein
MWYAPVQRGRRKEGSEEGQEALCISCEVTAAKASSHLAGRSLESLSQPFLVFLREVPLPPVCAFFQTSVSDASKDLHNTTLFYLFSRSPFI